MKTILISGGFDPIHIGHVRYINDAKTYGRVLVALNSDDWLMRKKGYVFTPFAERAEILTALSVLPVAVDDNDNTVVGALKEYKPDFFGNGGDRGPDNVPELDACEALNIKPVFNLGGDKIQSSSTLARQKGERDWGYYEVLHEGVYKIKILTVYPGKSLSIQKHQHRNEHWIFPHNNDYVFIEKGEVHTLHNPTSENIQVVEVQTGTYFGEDDEEKLFHL